MILDLVMVAGGLVALVVAGDALVRGAVNLALRLGIPALIVGLTIVAFGTSAPELLVSIKAVLAGADGLALGNVVGSNTANILLVLGLPALISALAVGRDLSRDYLTMIAATLLFIGLLALGPLTWVHGLVLLAGLAMMLGDNFLRARKARSETVELEGVEDGMPGLKIAALIGLGIIGLPLGAKFLVDGSVSIARTLGVTEAVIGLTLVAIGTSLPELATTMVAALRREGGVALGNVIGSNVFNVLGIIGVAALVGQIDVPADMFTRDLWVMLAASLGLGLFVWRGWSITWPVGIGLLLVYGFYLFSLFG